MILGEENRMVTSKWRLVTIVHERSVMAMWKLESCATKFMEVRITNEEGIGLWSKGEKQWNPTVYQMDWATTIDQISTDGENNREW